MKNTISFLLLFVLGISLCAVAAPQDTPKVVIKIAVGSYTGEIAIELFPDQAPITVDNFLQYVNSDYYDGLIFHRVTNEVIQGGGFEPNSIDPIRRTVGLRDSNAPGKLTDRLW